MYKLIACDLDETLIGDGHIIPKVNIDAINEASKMGVKFVPATGRGHRSIKATLKDLGLYDKEDEYIISFNGAGVVENKDFRILDFNGIDFDLAKELFEVGLTKDVCIHVYTKDDIYVYNSNEDEISYISERLKGFKKMEDNSIEFLRNVPIAKVLFQNLDREYLINIEEQIKNITKDKVTVTFSSNRYIEFNRIGIDKGIGVFELAKRLSIKQDEIMAIGDNFNDLAMLKAAGLSVAVKNAVNDIKEQVDYVCNTDNNKGAVAEAINKFILNKV